MAILKPRINGKYFTKRKKNENLLKTKRILKVEKVKRGPGFYI